MKESPSPTLEVAITLTVTTTAHYADYGIPEGGKGALLAAVARDFRADTKDSFAALYEFGTINIVTVTEANCDEAIAIASTTTKEEETHL